MPVLPTSDELLAKGQPISRRAFVKRVGALITGSALLVMQQRFPTTASARPRTTTLVRSTFIRHLGETFQVDVGLPALLALKLAVIRDLPAATQQTDSEQNFALLFRGPTGHPLTQATYRFEHNRIGSFALFIVPMAANQNGQDYEAVFNRIAA